MQAGFDVQTLAVGIAVLWFGLDGILLGFLLLTCTFISLLGLSSGLDNQQCPACTKPFPLGETAMRLLSSNMKTFIYQFDQPVAVLSAALTKTTKGSVMIGDKIQIKIKPHFIDPTAGRGIIEFKLSSHDDGFKTKAVCSIIPSTQPRWGLYSLALLLLLWTISVLVISLSITSIVMIVCAWTMIALAIQLTKILNEGKLENHLKAIISNIKH